MVQGAPYLLGGHRGAPRGAGSSVATVAEDSRGLNLGSGNDAHREGTDYKRDG